MTNRSMGSVDTVVLALWWVWAGAVIAETTWTLIRFIQTVSNAITHHLGIQALLTATLEHVHGAFHWAT